jgi:eukaryotic-like serine/threonine-protein kinase
MEEHHPTRLGRYQIERIIGRGAMGVIYLAHDPEADRQVALKTLPLDIITDKEQLSMLEKNLMHEAKIVSKLTHPSIVQIYDVQRAEEGGGLFFVVMEFVDGINLAVRMKQEPLLLWQLRRIMTQVCDGLHFAHEQQVVHRDVKPGNVLLTPDLQAKITDFGIAKVQRRATTIVFNQTGKMVGTPNYMAPEQVTDSEVDRRTDIFSLGCFLYRILTGKKAFPGKGIVDTLVKIVREPPILPTVHVPDLDPRIEAIVLKCLQKDKAQRYQSMLELKADLEAILPSPPAAAPPIEPAAEPLARGGFDDLVAPVPSRISFGLTALPSKPVPSESQRSLERAEKYLERKTYLAALLEVRRVLEKDAGHTRASKMRDEIYAALERR